MDVTREEVTAWNELKDSDVNVIGGQDTMRILGKVYTRLVEVHCENPDSDHMLDLRSVIECQPKIHTALSKIEEAIEFVAVVGSH